MKMRKILPLWLLTGLQSVLVVTMLSSCTGTEVGNGLKPKDDQDDGDHNETQAGKVAPSGAKPEDSAVSDAQNNSAPSLDTPLLQTLLLQSCGSPLNNAQQKEMILSRSEDKSVTTDKIFDVAVTAGVWSLTDGVQAFTIIPSGLWDFKGETGIKDGAKISDTFACGDVSRGTLTAVEHSTRYRGAYSVNLKRIADQKEYSIEWTATVDHGQAPLSAEYWLEQIHIESMSDQPEKAAQATVFAIYPSE